MLSPAATESTVSLIVHKGVSPDASFRRPDARLTLSICKRRAKPSRACQDHTGRDRQGRNDNRLCRPDPPDHGKNPRPVVKVKAGDPIKINWMLTNVNNAFPKPFHETNPLSARTHLNFSNSIIFSKSKQ
jgi:hypothetical protein